MGQAARDRADQDLARAPPACWSRAATLTASRSTNVDSRLVDDDLARLDADARLQAELVHLVEDRERRPDRALGVVLVRLRDAEGGQDGVAGELLDDAAVRLDAVRDLGRRSA